MKKLLIWLIVFVFYFSLNWYAWWPELYSGNFWLNNKKNLEYNLKLDSEGDCIELTEVLFRYYDLYNLQKFEWNNTRDTINIIEDIQESINLKKDLCNNHWDYFWDNIFSLLHSSNEATFGILESIWITNNYLLLNPYWLRVDDFTINNQLSFLTFDDYQSKTLVDENDIYQVVHLHTWYWPQDNSNKLKAFFTEEQWKDFSIMEVWGEYEPSIFSNELTIPFELKVKDTKMEVIFEVWYYVKKEWNYIKIPTIWSFQYKYLTWLNMFHRIDWYEAFRPNYICNTKRVEKINNFFDYKSNTLSSNGYLLWKNSFEKKLIKKTNGYKSDFYDKIFSKIIDTETFDSQLLVYKKEKTKEALYWCIHRNMKDASYYDIDMDLDLLIENMVIDVDVIFDSLDDFLILEED